MFMPSINNKLLAAQNKFARFFCNLTIMPVLIQDIMSFVRSYVVPEGFPDSVTPSYVPYMTWRALKVLLQFYHSPILVE